MCFLMLLLLLLLCVSMGSDETEVVEHVKDPFAPVLYMRIRKWHTEAKAE